MAVLLPDRLLGVRPKVLTVDAHGYSSGSSWGALKGPWPGRAEQRPDVPVGQPGGRTWVLALDPAAWPVLQGDLIADSGDGSRWLVTSADLLTNNADGAIDYVRIEAHTYATAGTAP